MKTYPSATYPKTQGTILANLLWDEYTSLEELSKFTKYPIPLLIETLAILIKKKMITYHPNSTSLFTKSQIPPLQPLKWRF